MNEQMKADRIEAASNAVVTPGEKQAMARLHRMAAGAGITQDQLLRDLSILWNHVARVDELARASEKVGAAPVPPAPDDGAADGDDEDNQRIIFWAADEHQELLVHDEIHDALDDMLDDYTGGRVATLYGFARAPLPPEHALAQIALEAILQHLDEDCELGDPQSNGPSAITDPMRYSAHVLAQAVRRDYTSWACEQAVVLRIDLLAWLRAKNPDWEQDMVAQWEDEPLPAGVEFDERGIEVAGESC